MTFTVVELARAGYSKADWAAWWTPEQRRKESFYVDVTLKKMLHSGWTQKDWESLRKAHKKS